MAVNAAVRWPVTALVAIGSVGAVAVGGLLASRYVGARRIGAAERLADALLDVERLREAKDCLAESPESALGHIAAYLAGVARQASQGVGSGGREEDGSGSNRTKSHPFTGAAVSILTEAEMPERILTYRLEIPRIGEVRGTRRIGGLRMSGVLPVHSVPDTAQVTLADGYSAQFESELQVTDYLMTGSNRLSGLVTLRDNRGNVGRLNVASDGRLSGTITRGNEVVGRFEGDVDKGLQFTPYQIGPAS